MLVGYHDHKARVIFGQSVIYDPFILRIRPMKKTCSLMRSYVVIKITQASLRRVMVGRSRLDRKATDNTKDYLGKVILKLDNICNYPFSLITYFALGASCKSTTTRDISMHEA
jgi:hypothetical protein